jgi:hypothetical protein
MRAMATVKRGKALVAQLRTQAGVRDPEALAAYLGRYKKARKSGLKPDRARKIAKGAASGSGAAIRDKENEIANNPQESAAVYGANGKLLFENKGGRSSVHFTSEQVGQMKGATLTHNHPGGSSFSPDDVALAVRTEMAEMRAVSSEWTHSVKPPEGGWSAEWGRKNGLIDSLNRHNMGVRQEFNRRITDGTLEIEEAEADHWHEVWKRVAKDTGVRYERRRR